MLVVVCFARDVTFTIILSVVMCSEFVKVIWIYNVLRTNTNHVQNNHRQYFILFIFFLHCWHLYEIYCVFCSLYIWAKKATLFYLVQCQCSQYWCIYTFGVQIYWRQQQFNSKFYCKLANFVSQLRFSVTVHKNQLHDCMYCIFLPSGDENKNSKQNLKALFKVEHIERQHNKDQSKSRKRERQRQR